MTNLKESILNNIYSNPSHPAAFASKLKLYNSVKNKNKNITKKDIDLFLSKQDSYTLHKKRLIKYPTAKTVSFGIDNNWQIDISSLIHLASYNNGIKYLLIVIDVKSRYLWIVPLKTKESKEVSKALMAIFNKGRIPGFITSDSGTEFQGQTKKLLANLDIGYYTLNSPSKASISERVQRTIKEKIYKYLTYNNTKTYIDILPDIVNAYNKTVHRITKNKPYILAKNINNINNINDNNKIKQKKIKQNKHKYKKGSYVRVSRAPTLMAKAYESTFNIEIFIINKLIFKNNIPVYKLTDLNNEKIEGIFYEQELQQINIDKNQNDIHRIDKVIPKRGYGKNIEYKVRWTGYLSSFDQWILKSSIVQLK